MKAIRWRVLLVIMVAAALALFQGQPAQANLGVCVDSVVQFNQGLTKGGGSVELGRSDPNKALGLPVDKEFVSLGYGGSIVLSFLNPVGGSITVFEETWGEYPSETAQVSVSLDGSNWTLLGTADNSVDMPTADLHPTTFPLGTCIKYVEIIDTTTDPEHTSSADGFDLNAVCAEYECPEELTVPVDIKPTSCPNPLNTNQRGVLPIAVLGTDLFDVNDIDPTSVLLEGVAPIRWSLEDVATPFEPYVGKSDCYADCTTAGPDGYLDLTLKFDAQDVVAALGVVGDGDCVVVHLTGSLFDGTSFSGEDVVKIIKKGP